MVIGHFFETAQHAKITTVKSYDIRAKYLKFFEGRGHKILPGSSLIPKDPTVLLTLAGMLQFKPIFLGIEKPEVSRATTVQKCIRTNDIENVGHTARHHTFFEMLGNFSFGDYFKKDAIAFAWELITKEYNLDKNRLYIAVYEKDDESEAIWIKDQGINLNRIIRLGEDNNFWAAGPTGPCGPCSEIYYDMGEKYGCGKPDCAPGCDCDRFLEIWNLVFMEFNRDETGSLTPLPKKNIDTGMGLERITSILQNVPSNFDTDLFVGVMGSAAKLTAHKDKINNISLRIIADHARAASFLISDGLVPGNEGRNYVLRRIIRRAVMHGRKIGIHGLFMNKLVEDICSVMGDFYTDLNASKPHIIKTMLLEEESFGRTIESGMEMVEKVIAKTSGGILSGEDAFKLYDTYGFPLELTKEIAKDKGFELDIDGFEKEMARQVERSKASSSKAFASAEIPQVKGLPETEFVGYEQLKTDATVIDVLNNYVILDKTPFYAESGGQDSDKGWLICGEKKVAIKRLIKTAEGVILHQVDGDYMPAKGETVEAIVDNDVREKVAAHHTSTHLLHAGLRKVLGNHVQQKGSSVAHDRFRLDFAHPMALKPEEVESVEKLVNDAIREAIPVSTAITTIDEAKQDGAMALFDAKYGEKVRLVRIGDFSKELCGGTHVSNTSVIGSFKIVKEGAIAQGIRRVEAVSGDLAKEYEALKKLEADKVQLAMIEKEKEKAEEKQRNTEALAMAAGLIEGCENIGSVKLVFQPFSGFRTSSLKILADEMMKKDNALVSVLFSFSEDKVSIVSAVSSMPLSLGIKAGDIVKQLSAQIGGKGGGRPDIAEAGAKISATDDRAIIHEKLRATTLELLSKADKDNGQRN